MTADARRHHPAAEEPRKFRYGRTGHHQNLADRYGAPPGPAAQFPPACGWP